MRIRILHHLITRSHFMTAILSVLQTLAKLQYHTNDKSEAETAMQRIWPDMMTMQLNFTAHF